MSYNSYKPRYSLYQPTMPSMPAVHGAGGCGASSQHQFGRRSQSAGNLYRTVPALSAANQNGLRRSPHFAENGFVPSSASSISGVSQANANTSATATATVTATATATTSTAAAIPDRYHRQRHTASLSTHSLPSLTPSIKSSDLDTSSTQTSTSSISSWNEEKDRHAENELPLIKEVDPKLEKKNLKMATALPVASTTVASSHAVKASVSTPNLATTKREPHRSQRTSNQAVEEALADLDARGEQPPSAEPVKTHRRRSSADSRTSLILPSERRLDSLRSFSEESHPPRAATPKLSPSTTPKHSPGKASATTATTPTTASTSSRSSVTTVKASAPTYKHSPPARTHSRHVSTLSNASDHQLLANPRTRPSPVRASRPQSSTAGSGSAKTGPVLQPVPKPANQPISPGNIGRSHSRTPSQFSIVSQAPIAYAPVRGEADSKPKFSQRLKSLFRKSTLPDSASISSNMSGKSGRSAFSSMSVRSTSSTFSFRSISQSSKRLFGKKDSKPVVSAPTFEMQESFQVTPPSPPPPTTTTPAANPTARMTREPTAASNARIPEADTSSNTYPVTAYKALATKQSNTSPNVPASHSASPAMAIPVPTTPSATPSPRHNSPEYDASNDDYTGSPLPDEECLEVPDTVFPRSLDDATAVANIRNSVERTASVDRKGSVRSVRSLHKPNDEEKVPNVQEVRVERAEELNDDDIFGQLDSTALDFDLALPKHLKKKRGVSFASQVMIYDTFSSMDYDRRPDPATCNHLTPVLAQQIKQELNNVKMNMEIHRDSRAFTHFF